MCTGGIRGTFSTLKKLLQEQYNITDLRDTAAPPTVQGGPPAAAFTAAAPAPVPPLPAAVPAAAAATPRPPPVFGLADYIVYQELVAGILQLSDPHLIAQGLAMCLTLLLIHGLISALRPVSQACAEAAAGQVAGSSSVLGWLCWPLVSVLDIPDSVGEVLSALLLVAVANKLLMLGAEAASTYLR